MLDDEDADPDDADVHVHVRAGAAREERLLRSATRGSVAFAAIGYADDMCPVISYERGKGARVCDAGVCDEPVRWRWCP